MIGVEQLTDELHASDSQRSLPDDLAQIRIQLQHVNLPKLADTGVLDFDSRSNAVRYCHDERVRKLLSFVGDELE